MKLKSFKKKGVTDGNFPDHSNYLTEQIAVDSKQQIVIMWNNDNDDRIKSKDLLAVTIDDGPNILLAKIREVRKVGDHVVARIEEKDLMSSKQLPSSRWKKFLTELKKKCDSGHHNKKRKTLLHVIKMAHPGEVVPESIQLQVRQKRLAPEAAQLAELRERIQRRIEEGDTAGNSLYLDELDELLVDDDVVIADANHVPKRDIMGAITIMMNGVSVTTSKTSSNKQSITISKQDVERALIYNTQQNGPVELDKDYLEDLLETKQWDVRVSVYSHDQALTVHSNKPVENITRSLNGEFVFELESDLAAGPGTFDLESALVQITSYELQDGGDVDGSAIEDYPASDVEGHDRDWAPDYENNKILEIPENNYELISLQDSKQLRLELQMPYASDRRLRSHVGENYFVSVDNLHGVFTVDRLVDDMIDQPEKQILVDFSYVGGGDLDLLEAALSGKPENIIMKRLNNASPQIDEAIQLTLEKRALGPDADLPTDAKLSEIAAEIDELIVEDQDGVTLNEFADWLVANHEPQADLAATGVEYNPIKPAYHTKSSVTGGLKLDVWMSADRKYSYIDLKPDQLATVESVSHSSTIVKEWPVSEVKEGKFAQILDEVRQRVVFEEVRQQDPADVDPYPLDLVSSQFDPLIDPLRSQYHRLSIYNGEKGIDVCNNEPIWRILRKKKDGKCIYRIVVKNGVRANRIHHGKHRKCIMYMDRKTYPS